MDAFLSDLRHALAGTGELILGTPREHLPRELPGGVTIVVTTSGSTTGAGRPVGLTPQAITASANATHARLGGPGQWLLTLPHEHIAGLQVCARSLLAGHEPVVRGAETLHEAIARMAPGTRHYTSLVPTQLVRILDAGGPDLAALATLDAILLGGAAIDPTLLTRARRAGLTILTTYGSTETAGGCVYNGRPLDGVTVRIDDSERIWLTGPTLAWGYLDEGPSDFISDGDTFWFRTSDLGSMSDEGELTVLGRADDVIITGGVNVHPVAVENIIGELAAVADCVVVGIPSTDWGEEVAAVVEVREGVDEGALLAEIRERTRAALSGAAAPRALVVVEQLPTRGPGKVDRRAATEIAAQVLARGGGVRYGGEARG